jgi:hypothetical protein
MKIPMIRVAIVDPDGKTLSPQDLSTATELQQVVEQARNLIRDCDRLARAQSPKDSATRATPYFT